MASLHTREAFGNASVSTVDTSPAPTFAGRDFLRVLAKARDNQAWGGRQWEGRGDVARINSLISKKRCCMTGGVLKETRNENT